MATEFVSTLTGECGFVRFCRSSRINPEQRTSFEFGTVTNWEAVRAEFQMGGSFEPFGGGSLEGDPTTLEELEQLLLDDRVTFGVMAVTVELGSGQATRFTQEGDL